MPYQKVFTLELQVTIDSDTPLSNIYEREAADLLNQWWDDMSPNEPGLGVRLSSLVARELQVREGTPLERIEQKLDELLKRTEVENPEPVPLAHITTVNAGWLQEAHCPCCGEGGFQPEADKCGVAGAVVLSNLRGFCSVCTQVWQCRCGEFINGESAAAHECDWSTAR
jgi:hypothetical protein